MNKKIFLSLDTDLKSALKLSKELKDYIYGIKVGSLYNQIGLRGLKEFEALLPAFEEELLQSKQTLEGKEKVNTLIIAIFVYLL